MGGDSRYFNFADSCETIGRTVNRRGGFTLRSESVGLIRISRIARPGALYDAAASAQTFEAIGETSLNLRDFAEAPDVNIASAVDMESYSRIPRYGDPTGI